MANPIDLVGQKFGRLTITHRANKVGETGGVRWGAVCTCGGTTVACASDFKKRTVNSCGCLRKELASATATHGESQPRTKEYAIWCGMKQRCLSPTCKDYPGYGGRGIQVAKEFMAYSTFLRVMGRCPPNHSLERRDNGGDYTPSNCFWATPLEQGNNKRNNVVKELNGETRTLAEWGRDPRCVVPYTCLKSRVGRQGWELLTAMTTPAQPKNWMKGNKQSHFKLKEK